ncbi:metalloproteinase inhibitor 3-like isoform X2 [Oculina patagonica]
MTAILCSVAVLLCVITMNEACSCKTGHPQERFCFADFVIRAKVLSQEEKNDSRVFNLEILQTFKGASRVNQTEGIHQVNGSGQGSLFAKAFSEKDEGACGVFLTSGTLYLLGGYIGLKIFRKNKLELDLCSLHEEWSRVTPSQRKGVSRIYGQNCECKIFPRDENKDGKLKGCQYKPVEKHDYYCAKNDDGTKCSWRSSANKATNMTFYFVVVLYVLIFV